MNLCNSHQGEKVKDFAFWNILLMSYTNHYSHTSSVCYHCKCKLTETKRDKNMCLSRILIKQRMQTKMHFSQENLLIYFLISNLCLGTMHFQGLTSEVSLFLPVSTCWSQNLQIHFIKCRTKQKMNNSCLSSVPFKTLHKSNR